MIAVARYLPLLAASLRRKRLRTFFTVASILVAFLIESVILAVVGGLIGFHAVLLPFLGVLRIGGGVARLLALNMDPRPSIEVLPRADHALAVRRGAPNCMILVSLPYGAYATPELGVANAIRLARVAQMLQVPVWATEENPSGLGGTVESLQPFVAGRVLAKPTAAAPNSGASARSWAGSAPVSLAIRSKASAFPSAKPIAARIFSRSGSSTGCTTATPARSPSASGITGTR